MSRYRALNWLALILLAIVWGSSFILMKKGLDYFSNIEVASLRIAITFLVFLPLALRYFKRIPRQKLKTVALVGLLGSFIPAYLYTTAQTRIDSAVAGILNSLTPLFAFLWGVLLFSLKGNVIRFLGILIGLIGASLLAITPGQGFSINLFAWLIVLATVLYGFNVNLTKEYLQNVKPIDITAVSFMCIGPFAIGWLFFTDFFTILKTNPESYIGLGYIGLLAVMGTALALWLFWWLLQRTDAIFSSMVTYLIPVVAVIWGLIDGEKLGLEDYLGFALISVSVFLVGRKSGS